MYDTGRIKYVAPGIKVWSGYARDLADNGQAGDNRQVLRIAPDASGSPDEWVYLETNGGPLFVGWVDDDEGAGYVFSNGFAKHVGDPCYRWIFEALGWSQPCE